VIIALATVSGVLIALLALILSIRQALRESKTDRRSQINDAVKSAVDPLREQLLEMTNDRNYHRKRADAYEAELRKRDR
jgi:vacuolar-type H+-ATPase subunit E/Vma4